MTFITFDQLIEIASELTIFSGVEWNAIDETPPIPSATLFYSLVKEDGEREQLFFRNPKSGVVSISGVFRAGKKYLDHDGSYSINCSASKTPTQIAKDINRRLLPDYFQAYAKAHDCHTKWQSIYEQQAQTLNDFAELLGDSKRVIPGKGESIYFYNKKVDSVRVSGTKEVELRLTLPINEAKAIVKQLVRQ